MLPAITSLLVLALLPQGVPKKGPSTAPVPSTPVTASAQALKSRIHKMRSNLLLGGELVRKAETEALRFYEHKVETIEQGLDSLRADLSEKRAAYKLALGRVTQATDAAGRVAALREASDLRRSLQSLKEEENTLKGQRKNLSRLITAVKGRDRSRKVLAARLEASAAPAEGEGIPLPAIGLAPDVQVKDASFELEQGLVDDLLKQDPRKGRGVLFEADPDGYWVRFPLQPPAAALLKAFTFPPPDPPGRR